MSVEFVEGGNDRTTEGRDGRGGRPRRRRPRRRGTAALGAAAVAALVLLGSSACQPVTHPVATAIEPTPGPVAVKGLSDDGAYAFVTATAAGATVPGAGTWRVDRRDGTAVAVPNGRPSPDGRRVLTFSGYAPQIWEDGVTTTGPAWSVVSQDLRWGLLYDGPSGHYRRLELATGTFVDVEAGHPRPAGFVPLAWPLAVGGVADGGAIVWFPLRTPDGLNCLTRFITVATGRVDDFPFCDSDLRVAPSGAGFVRALDPVTYGSPYVNIGGPRRLELYQTVAPDPVRVLTTSSPSGWFDGVALSDSGWVLWAVESSASPSGWRAESVVAVTPTETATFPADPDLGDGDQPLGARISISAGGRWLVHTTRIAGDPIHVLDRLTGQDEVLASVSGTPNRGALITDDGTVVVATENTMGWIEHTPSPTGP